MSFTPLNRREQTEYDIQTHIREVELENALQLYQKALRFHYEGEKDQALEAYETLMASDVLKDALEKGPGEASSPLPIVGRALTKGSSVALLPYLVFRNHATLLLDNLEGNVSQVSNDLSIVILKQILLEYATALRYDGEDQSLWHKIVNLSSALELKRVQRFALENVLSDAARSGQLGSTSLLWDSSGQEQDCLAQNKLCSLVQAIGDTYSATELSLRQINTVSNDRTTLDHAHLYNIALHEDSHQDSQVQILMVQPTSCNWYAVLRAVVEKFRVSHNSPSIMPLHFSFELPDTLNEASDDDLHGRSDLLTEDNISISHVMEDEIPDEASGRKSSIASTTTLQSAANEDETDQETIASKANTVVESFAPAVKLQTAQPSAVLVQNDNRESTRGVGHRMHELNDEAAGDSSESDGDDIAEIADDSVSSSADQIDVEDSENDEHDDSRKLEYPSPDHGLFGRESQETAVESQNNRKRSREASPVADDTMTRASKRVKQRSSVSVGRANNPAQNVLMELFSPLGIDLESFFRAQPISPDEDDFDIDSCDAADDLKLLLMKEWQDDKVDSANTRPNEVSSTSAISKIMALDYPPLKCPKKDSDCALDDLKEFIAKVENGSTYFRCVNLELILALLSNEKSPKSSPYLASAWSQNLRALIMQLLIAEEMPLCQKVSLIVAEEQTVPEILYALSWSQAIFELFLDTLVAEEKARLVVSSSPTTNLESRLRVQRWSVLVDQLFAMVSGVHEYSALENIRYQWACAVFHQATGAPVEDVLHEYQELLERIKSSSETLDICLPNCQSMQSVNLNTIGLELSKLSTLEFFDAVFESSRQSDHTAVYNHLRPILLASEDIENHEQSVVEQYLRRSPLDFRFKLWEMLAKATCEQDRPGDAIHCYIKCLETSMIALDTEDVRSMSRSLRQVEVLRTLNRTSVLIKDAFKLLSTGEACLNAWHLSRGIESLQICFNFLGLLQVFMFYEDLVAEDSSHARNTLNYLKFRDRRRQDVLRMWILVYRIYKRWLILGDGSTDATGHALAILINFLHEELGVREYCHLLDGVLLSLFEDELFVLDRAETECDLVQVLHCKYELSYQVGSFIPWEHYARPSELTRNKAIRILPFVLTFVQEKSPGLWLPKADIKIALERLHTVLWPIIVEMPSTVRSQLIVDRYLAKDIVAHDLTNALRGILDIESADLAKSAEIEDKGWSALTSLSLVLGRCYLSMYQARSKNTNKGPADLEQARKYFRDDLCIMPRRPETWWALGYINAAIVDTELGFDAQRIVDHKEKTAHTQRESLLCYMLSISLSVKSRDNEFMDTCVPARKFSDILFEFGHHIYNACRQPMAMKCFEGRQVRYTEKGAGKAEMSIRPGITTAIALKTAAKCLHSASATCSEKWRCRLLLGKVHEKLYMNPGIALEDYKNAIEVAPAQNQGEHGPLIDPHYRMVSSVYKYLSRDAINPADALHYLSYTSFAPLGMKQVENPSKTFVIDQIKTMLDNICAADKRHWHHRPIHRLAVLAHNVPRSPATELGLADTPDVVARTMLESLFTARGSGGNLLSIWKPEFERPGRHYYYTNRYTKYYIELLFVQAELDTIFSFMRRLRKAHSNVLHHRDIWQDLCENYIALAKKKEHIPNLDADELIDVVDMPEFNSIAKDISEAADAEFDKSGLPALRLMRDFHELRRLNGGLYDANKIDDELVNCYLILYRDMQQLLNTRQAIIGANETSLMASTESTLTTAQALLTRGTGNFENSISKAADVAAESPILTPAPKSRGRAKEVKILKVGRRDILSRCFALCKPKTALIEARATGNKTKAQDKTDDMAVDAVDNNAAASPGSLRTRSASPLLHKMIAVEGVTPTAPANKNIVEILDEASKQDVSMQD